MLRSKLINFDLKNLDQIIKHENRHKFLPPNVSGVHKRSKQNMEE
jgi:hypothetical protein